MQKKAGISKALSRKYPEAVVLVVTRSPKGKANVMAVGWVSMASLEPAMLMLGIDDAAYTYELIRKTKEFVVAFPNERMRREVLYAGTHHGHKRDKLAETGLATQKARKVRPPILADAVANFECRLVTITRPGDCPLIIGKIITAHENTDPRLKRLYTVGKDYRLGGVRATGRK